MFRVVVEYGQGSSQPGKTSDASPPFPQPVLSSWEPSEAWLRVSRGERSVDEPTVPPCPQHRIILISHLPYYSVKICQTEINYILSTYFTPLDQALQGFSFIIYKIMRCLPAENEMVCMRKKVKEMQRNETIRYSLMIFKNRKFAAVTYSMFHLLRFNGSLVV